MAWSPAMQTAFAKALADLNAAQAAAEAERAKVAELKNDMDAKQAKMLATEAQLDADKATFRLAQDAWSQASNAASGGTDKTVSAAVDRLTAVLHSGI